MKRTVPLALVLTLIVAGVVLAASRYSIPRQVIGNAGGRVAAGNYVLSNTSGQVVAGHVTAGGYKLCAGFWCEGAQASPPIPRPIYLPAIFHNYPLDVYLGDAPDHCPGYLAAVGLRYHDNFGHTNDNDWFDFVAVAGTTYTLQTFDLGAHADTLLSLYEPDCTTLIANNDDREPGNKSSLVSWISTAGGTYHAMVRGYDWTIHGTGTEYTFSITTGSATIAQKTTNKPIPPATPASRGN